MLVEGTRFERVLAYSELISAILLAIATVGTAWCAYQSAVWSGIQAFRIAESNRLSREATMLQLAANQQAMLDISFFLSYLEAIENGRPELAEMYRGRFGPELESAVKDWQGGGEEGSSPPAAAGLPEFDSRLKQQAQDAAAQANQLLRDAHRANHIADTYLLATVMLASVLFFGGVATKFKHPDVRVFLLILGGLNLVGAIVGVVLLPKIFV